jgi:hypothetical protein
MPESTDDSGIIDPDLHQSLVLHEAPSQPLPTAFTTMTVKIDFPQTCCQPF